MLTKSLDMRQMVLDELEPLFKEAKEKGLWFYSYYQSLWFSPEELQDHHKQGKFIWSKESWKLRDPQELLERKKVHMEHSIQEYKQLKARLA